MGLHPTRNRPPVQIPALASTRAGTPTSRSAAAEISLRLHHQAAAFTGRERRGGRTHPASDGVSETTLGMCQMTLCERGSGHIMPSAGS
jgi:hypothetical protein